MDSYVPPYTISNDMLQLISDISEKLGKINRYTVLDTRPYLRRSNRIKSIHASLKIEANSLSLSQVRAVIDGQPVIGEPKDILEVQNAYSAYEEIKKVNPYSLKDLKRVHGMMTKGILQESGVFRKGQEGVFSGDTCIFVAPPPDLVPELISNLFKWIKKQASTVHPLILSSIFHYEFVFIHPFADGNGRMARLWQTVLLSEWRDIFEFMPIESQIEASQEEYYQTISECHANGNSDRFIVFMLRMIDNMLEETIEKAEEYDGEISEYVARMLNVMNFNIPYRATEIMEKLGLKSKETFRKNYMNPAIEQGFVEMTIPDKPQSRNQCYVRKR